MTFFANYIGFQGTIGEEVRSHNRIVRIYLRYFEDSLPIFRGHLYRSRDWNNSFQFSNTVGQDKCKLTLNHTFESQFQSPYFQRL